jgi:hypothetical protein
MERRARVVLTWADVREKLGLPDSAQIIGARFNPQIYAMEFELLGVGEQCHEGALAPLVTVEDIVARWGWV